MEHAAELFPGEVRLWTVSCDEVNPDALASLYAALAQEEQAKADRFHFARDRIVYIVAHAMLRRLLTAHTAAPIRFCRNPWGKPELDAPGNRLRFSLTHTRGLAACAVARDHDVGIDAEALNAAVDTYAIAESNFAPAEIAQLRAMSDAERTIGFYRLWTLKEAFIKAVGGGLSVPLVQFAFTLDPLRFACAPGLAIDPGTWRFHEQSVGRSHRLAVALCVAGGAGLTLRHESRDIPGLCRIFRAPAASEV
jgi:4'-phosphopantetheinyl transferase